MKRPFDTLFVSLQKSLNNLDRDLASADRYGRAIGLIRESLLEIRAVETKFITGRDTEIAFFREVWPAFFGQLLLYVRLYQFEMQRWSTPGEGMAELIRQEENRVAAFFRSNRGFWMYYRSGSVTLDEQFTRAYSRSRIFDPLSMLIDGEATTLASYRAAKGLAMEWYGEWLAIERDRLEHSVVEGPGARKKRYQWKETKSAAMEWIKSQALAGSIHIDGELATARQLKELWEETFAEELKGFDKLLYASDARKKDPTPYLTKLKNAFMGRKARLGK